MQKIIKRVVTKKRSSTNTSTPMARGPRPLAHSSMVRGRHAPQKMPHMELDLRLSSPIRGPNMTVPPSPPPPPPTPPPVRPKYKIVFPNASHERESIVGGISFDDTYDSGTYGDIHSTPPSVPAHISSLRSGTPPNINYSQAEPHEEIAHLNEVLSMVEARERIMIQTSLDNFHQARRKLMMDKKFFQMKQQ